MKKILVMMMGLGFSMGAMADGDNTSFGATGATTTAGSDGTTDIACQALNENVTINTSANVRGYVDCPSTYTIAVATCHEAGRVDDSGNVNIYFGTSSGGSITPDTTQTECTDTTVGAVAKGAS